MTRFALAAVLVSIVGCGEPVTPNAPPPGPTGASKAAALAPAVAAASEDYYYNPAGKRDPFQGFLQRQARPDGDGPKDGPPLQRWDIDKFALTGVIWDTQAPRALLVDPEGIGHSVRLGTYVGRNWGKVSSISQEGVVVTEEYQTLDGELVVNPVSVRFAAGIKK